jgi:hypothetical protein
VNGDTDKLDLGAIAPAGGLSGNYTSGADSVDFSVSNEGATGFGYFLNSSDVTAGSYEITFDVVLNSGSLAGVDVVINDPSNYQNQGLVSGSNSFSGTISDTGSIYFRTSGTAVADVSITNITLTKTDIDKLDLGAIAPAGGLSGNYTSGTDSADFSVSNEGSTGYGYLLDGSDVGAGSYEITFDVVLNSGSLSGVSIVINDPSNYQSQGLVSGSNSFSGTVSDTGQIFFRTSGTAVADVSITNITLIQTTADGHVKTWYDQSGNTNHATQTDPAKQPKIVEGGNLIADGIDFDGTDDFLSINFGAALSQPNSIFMVHTSDTATESSNEFFDTADSAPRTLFDQSGAYYRMLAGINKVTSLTVDANQKTLVGAFYNATSSFLSKNGTASSTFDVGNDSIDDTSNIGYSAPSGNYYDGTMDEFIIYNSDQSANRTAIEANIGDYYSIDLPAGVDSGNNEVDGFVTKWYDQSGNGNDAVQTTAANQPKIVESGVLVTRNGDAAIKSTSDNLMTFTLDSLSADGQQSVFAVLENDVTSQDGFGDAFRVTSDTGTTRDRRPYWFVNPTGGLAFTVDSASGYQNTDREYRLYSHVMNDAAGGTSTIHQDGTQVDTRSITLDANATFQSGALLGVTTNATGALYMSEVIYYPSDQSDNRTAIETNIADEYGITLS